MGRFAPKEGRFFTLKKARARVFLLSKRGFLPLILAYTQNAVRWTD